MKIAASCLLGAAFALTACINELLRPEEVVVVEEVVIPRTPDHLVRFDVVTGAETFGTFQKVGPLAWEGPHPDGGRIVTWSETGVDRQSLELLTATPRVRTLTVHSDGRVTALGLTGAVVLNPIFE